MSVETEGANKIISAAGVALSKASAELLKTTTALIALSEKPEDILLKIQLAEQEYATKKAGLDERFRADKVEFDLKVKENGDAVLEKLLSLKGLTAIPTSELAELKQLPLTLETKFKSDLTKEVSIVSSKLNSEHANKIALSEAEFKTKEAENVSEIKSLRTVITQLEATNTMLVKQLDDKTRVEIERAKSSSVNITNTGK